MLFMIMRNYGLRHIWDSRFSIIDELVELLKIDMASRVNMKEHCVRTTLQTLFGWCAFTR